MYLDVHVLPIHFVTAFPPELYQRSGLILSGIFCGERGSLFMARFGILLLLELTYFTICRRLQYGLFARKDM